MQQRLLRRRVEVGVNSGAHTFKMAIVVYNQNPALAKFWIKHLEFDPRRGEIIGVQTEISDRIQFLPLLQRLLHQPLHQNKTVRGDAGSRDIALHNMAEVVVEEMKSRQIG